MNIRNTFARRPKRRGTSCRYSKESAGRRHRPRFEILESRCLLSGNPTITSWYPDGPTNEPVASILLELSEPLVGADARDMGNYGLLHLGADRAEGGNDDTQIAILPTYEDGSTQLEIATVANLSQWTEVDYGFPAGIFGDWEIEATGTSVTQRNRSLNDVIGTDAFRP